LSLTLTTTSVPSSVAVSEMVRQRRLAQQHIQRLRAVPRNGKVVWLATAGERGTRQLFIIGVILHQQDERCGAHESCSVPLVTVATFFGEAVAQKNLTFERHGKTGAIITRTSAGLAVLLRGTHLNAPGMGCISTQCQ